MGSGCGESGVDEDGSCGLDASCDGEGWVAVVEGRRMAS